MGPKVQKKGWTVQMLCHIVDHWCIWEITQSADQEGFDQGPQDLFLQRQKGWKGRMHHL